MRPDSLTYKPGQLVFVYNADAGPISALRDAIHKTLRPETYPCSLCAITYGMVSMKPEWRSFISTLNPEPLFLYRDQLQGALTKHEPPFAALWTGTEFALVATELDLRSMTEVSDLIEFLKHV